jgi:CRP/FNR family transcriptional regulator, anaerobic regulatory protein
MEKAKDPEKLLITEFPGTIHTDLREDMLNQGQLMVAERGKTIQDFREEIKAIPLVLKGFLNVYRVDRSGGELLIYYVRPGESCAMTLASGLKGERSRVRVLAQCEVLLLLIPVNILSDFRIAYPAWNNFILETLVAGFGEMIGLVDDLTFHHVDYRLLKYLKEKSQLLQTPVLPVSHMEIARDINTSREVVSRLLKKMEKEGKLKLARERIVLKNTAHQLT